MNSYIMQRSWRIDRPQSLSKGGYSSISATVKFGLVVVNTVQSLSIIMRPDLLVTLESEVVGSDNLLSEDLKSGDNFPFLQ